MITYLTTSFRWFFKLEAASGLLLLIGAVIALILSNSVLSDYYFRGHQIELRNKYRKLKNFSDADAIRKELLSKGISLLDSKNGTEWTIQ